MIEVNAALLELCKEKSIFLINDKKRSNHRI